MSNPVCLVSGASSGIGAAIAAAYAFTHIPYMTGQSVAVDGGFTLVNGFPNRDLFLKEGLRQSEGSGRID